MDARRRPHVSLDLLRGFCVAARHLSFTRAARELHVTQSAISHGIKTLEHQLGRPLFRRMNRTLELTRAGRDLLDATEPALGLLDRAIERFAPAEQALAVTTTTSLASLWLAPRLARFTRLHPGINVRIAAVNDMVNLNLEREHIDVAIRFVHPGWDIPGGERLFDYQTFPVCSPQLVQAASQPLRTPADLAQHVLLDFERLAFGRMWSDWDHWFEGVELSRINASGILHFSHYDQVIQAALEGSGVAIGKLPHLSRYLEQGLLCAPFGPEWVATPGSFFLVVAPSAIEREPVAAFVAWLRSQANESSALEPPARRPRRSRK